ncbi:5'-AMP-activated protein kinase subunit gamma [Rhodotorula toruloides]|nr:5'-AMP-activated protein kinase subunit gamma [Rhodotorula toruloides]
MPLTRSDSSQSAWVLPQDDEGDFPEQRRLRHLSGILLRNLSLDPARDGLSTSLAGPGKLVSLNDPLPTSLVGKLASTSYDAGRPSADINDFAIPSPRKGRRRAGSTASWSGTLAATRAEDAELVLDAKPPARIRPKRSSSVGTLLGKAVSIDEEEGTYVSAATSNLTRACSASRASIGSAGSGSTIRQAPRLPPSRPDGDHLAKEKPPPPASSLFALKERQRQEGAMKRRLVDSFVTLELVPAKTGAWQDERPVLGSRRRSGSVASVGMRRSGSGNSLRGSTSSPTKSMRRRTISASLLASDLPFTASSSSPRQPQTSSEPFFISPISPSAMHADILVDHNSFIRPDSPLSPFPDDSGTQSWPGLSESRLRIKVFARPTDGRRVAKGKWREGEDGWRVLTEWDVELDGLTSLGRDPANFPPLPPNTLVFALSTSPSDPFASPSSSSSADLEYFTAPLTLLYRSRRRRLVRRNSVSTLHPRAWSEDEADASDSDLSSCSSDEDGGGNMSDPGVGNGSGTIRTRPRSGTIRSLRSRLIKAEEERRKRAAVLERSRRETKMVKAADWEEMRRLWEGEWELRHVRSEQKEVRRRIDEALEQGWAELERERAELQDRVDDLDNVKEAVRDELLDSQAEIDRRKEGLAARRERLRRARELDEQSRENLRAQTAALDDSSRALDKLNESAQIRRTQLITLLSHIFPIEPVEPTSTKHPQPDLLFSIVGLPLPNSSFPSSYSDDLLSSALGYAAQVTQLLAAYLGVPLCYPIQCRGSRSVVFDEISMMKGPRAFPLYGKGVDQYRFDYGVFLLNKNIEQLMYSQRLIVLDLRNTLPNLKSLILSLSYDPSHADYRNSTLLPSGPFAGVEAEEEELPASPTEAAALAEATTGAVNLEDDDERGRDGASSRMTRSSSNASTIRAPSTSRQSNGADADPPNSPTPSVRSVNGDATGSDSSWVVSGNGSGRTTPTNRRRKDTEKRIIPAREDSSAHHVSLTIKSTRPASIKTARSRTSSNASNSSGYGAKIRDGLWSAVAGGSGSRERREGRKGRRSAMEVGADGGEGEVASTHAAMEPLTAAQPMAAPRSATQTPNTSLPSTANPSPTTSTATPPPKPRRPRPYRTRTTAGTNAPERTRKALEGIRAFLASKSCYDILPESFRLIVFDNKLGITKSLQALVTNGVVSAPLYDSTTHRFAGMFTLADVVHLIQYYYLTAHKYENVVAEVEAFQLESLREIEQAIDVPPPPTISVHPDQPLSDACAALVRTHARRLPLVDRDDQTGKETIISVLTQYRVLKFIAINCTHDCGRLDQSIGSLGIGSYASWYQPTSDTTSSSAPGPSASSAQASASESNGEAGPSTAAASSDASSSTDNRSTPTSTGTETPTNAYNAPHMDPSASTDPAHLEGAHDDAVHGKDGEDAHKSGGMGLSDRYWPLSTATMQTSVFDVVHIFSERGISAVPIVDEDGVVLNLYETVDIVDLVRQNAYQVLDSTIEDAINRRSPDFTGVMTCTPSDTLASILVFVRERRCHRFVIVEPEDVPARNGEPARKKGSLVGILSLSDVLRFLVGHENLKGMEVPGLGVHGLRGVHNDANAAGQEYDDAISVTDASSVGGGSKTTSRRGSEATTDAGGSATDVRLAQQAAGLGLEDVIEAKAE